MFVFGLNTQNDSSGEILERNLEGNNTKCNPHVKLHY